MSSEEALKILKEMRDEIQALTDKTEADEIQEQALTHGINALMVINCLGENDGSY